MAAAEAISYSFRECSRFADSLREKSKVERICWASCLQSISTFRAIVYLDCVAALAAGDLLCIQHSGNTTTTARNKSAGSVPPHSRTQRRRRSRSRTMLALFYGTTDGWVDEPRLTIYIRALFIKIHRRSEYKIPPPHPRAAPQRGLHTY